MGMPLKDASLETPNAADAFDAEWTTGRAPVGDRLAAARKAKGLTYQDVFNGTKIKIANIAAIETGDHKALPAVPFTVGFVKAYAQFLGLSPEAYASDYRAECFHAGAAAHKPGDAAAPAAAPPIAAPALEAPEPAIARTARSATPETLVSWLGIGACVLCVLWIGARIVSPKGEAATPPSRIEAGAPSAAAAAAAAPAAPSLKQTAVAPAGSAGTAQGEPGGQTMVALADDPQDSSAAPTLSEEARQKAEALAAALNPSGGPKAPVPAAPSLKPPVMTSTPETAVAEDVGRENEEASQPASYTDASEAAPPAGPATPEAASVAAPNPTQVPAMTSASPSARQPAASAVPPEPQQAATPAANQRVVEAKLSRNVQPEYPDRCMRRAAAVETVELAFVITAEGTATGVYVAQSSNECFNSAALKAAYDLRFAPRTVNGKPVLQEGKRMTFRFARP